jgi:hypothetical protein
LTFDNRRATLALSGCGLMPVSCGSAKDAIELLVARDCRIVD